MMKRLQLFTLTVLAASCNGFAETPQQLSRNVIRLRIALST
jgi:hypothetical protein